MSNASDFIIENGVLTKYVGPGGDVVIPDGVKAIGDRAFDFCDNLISVRIPDGVAAIGNCAFHCCFKLTNVSIPDSVTAIGDEAFAGCHSLVSVNIPDNAISIGYNAFGYCRSLTAVTIPNSVISINEDAFRGCKNLVSVTISNNVAAIGNWAFHECAQLTKVVLPTSLGSCVTKVFDFNDKLRIETPDLSALPAKYRICAALCFAEDGGSTTDPRFESHGKYLKANAGKIRETAVQNLPLLTLLCREGCINAKDIETYIADVQKTGNTEAIAMVLEYQNSRLTKKQKENAANQKERQENTVFDRMVARTNREGISGLNFVVTGDVRTFEKRSDLKAFIERHGAKLQSAMSSKTDYLIMNDDSSNSEKAQKAKTLGIEVITERKFNDIAGRSLVIEDGVLTHYRGEGGEIIIPDGVTVIGKSSFKDCIGLTSVKIPDGVTTIEERAFQGCKLLSGAKLPASVTTLGIGAFYGCESLTDFTIPDTVITIGAKAFSGCAGLADDNGFLIVRNVLVGYFGKECEITIPDGVTEIEQRAFFADCNHLVSVIIPDSIKIIGDYAFSCLDQLTSVTIGNGIEAIGIRAFSACEKLTTVSIPNKPIYIEDSAFISSEQVQFQKRSI